MELESDDQPQTPADAIAGLLAAVALFTALIGLFYRPLRVTPFSIAVALVAIAMTRRHEKLGQLALAVSGACFVVGTIIAVLTNNPVF